MVERFVTWLLALLRREHFVIGRAGNPYLTRWTLWGKRFGADGKNRVFLHLFHRSDSDSALHDHPWAYWSLILGPGYYEEVPLNVEQYLLDNRFEWLANGNMRRWYGPLSLLKRPPEWRHRVELAPGRRCWTLIWTGPKVRSWGFYCEAGWKHWKEFVEREDAGLLGCGD